MVMGGYRLVMGSYMALRVFFGGYGLLFCGKGLIQEYRKWLWVVVGW